MSHVLVEEPRSGRAYARVVAGTRRQRRQQADPGDDTAPSHLGMRRDGGHDKEFGEHLGPLYRWLRGQVNRPWRLVWSELCATLDRRSPVQAHLFQHIDAVVEYQTQWRDGQVWVQGWRGPQPLAASGTELFVHPCTGILLRNRGRDAARRRRQAARAQRALVGEQDRRAGLPGLAADTQLHRLSGLWFAVTLRPLPALAAGETVFDAVLARRVSGKQQLALQGLYGSGAQYACAKRQLDARALRRFGLINADE